MPFQRTDTQFKTPDQISGLAIWLDASSINQTIGSNVTQWNDKSGNNNHATIPSGLIGPVLNTGTINKPAAVFNGINMALSIPYTSNITSANNDVFVLSYNYTQISSQAADNYYVGYIFNKASGTGFNRYLWYEAYNLKATPTINASFTGYNGASTTTFNSNLNTQLTPSLAYINCINNGGNTTINTTVNKVTLTATGTESRPLTTDPLLIGCPNQSSAYFYYGEIYEMLWFNRNLTTIEVSQVKNYLQFKYQLWNLV
jgi:hypothetical protein